MATRYWVGGTGDWDATTTTHWSATSGGVGGASVPSSSDQVNFDANSGGGTVTPNYNINVLVLRMLTFNGTIDFSINNNSPTIDSFQGNGTATRTLKMGSGTWYFPANGIVWSLDTPTNFTLDAGTSTIKCMNTMNNSSIAFYGGGLTYNNLWFTGTSTAANVITGSNTFTNLKDDGTSAHTIKFVDGTDQNITSLTINGSAGKLITLTGISTAGWRISDTTGTNTVTYCNIAYSTAEGGATWIASELTNTNGGNNTGWLFYSPFTNPANIYASDNTYATITAASGVLTVEISKDAGANWSAPLTKTYGASDTLETFGAGATETWGMALTRADMVNANFRVRLSGLGYKQIYKTFGFSTGSDILTGIEIAIEGNYASSTLSLDLLEVKIYYGTSVLPVQAGSQAFASDGRKAGEGAGSGTGLLVYYDGNNWIASDSGATVSA